MQTQKTLSGLCRGTPLTLERLRSSLRRRRRRSWTSPFNMKPHDQLLLFGLINVHIPTWTPPTPPTVGYVGLCLCLWWMDFAGGCHCSTKEILNHSAIVLGWQKDTFLSLVNHNISLLSWCKPDLQSIDLGHGVTYYINTSFIEVTKVVIQK